MYRYLLTSSILVHMYNSPVTACVPHRGHDAPKIQAAFIFFTIFQVKITKGGRKVNLKYAKRSEDTEQIKLINWCRINELRYPELRWCFHIPNGGKRNKQEAEKLKQMGVKAGVADIQLPFSRGIYHGMFIELKYEDNKPTKNQIEFLQAMQAAGHYCCVCYSSYAAIRTIEGYLSLTDGAEMTDAYIDEIEPLEYEIHKKWSIPIIMDSWRR